MDVLGLPGTLRRFPGKFQLAIDKCPAHSHHQSRFRIVKQSARPKGSIPTDPTRKPSGLAPTRLALAQHCGKSRRIGAVWLNLSPRQTSSAQVR